MHSPYGTEAVEDCGACNLCAEGFFCDLPKSAREAFQKIKFTVSFPAGAALFVEGQQCRGIYILCKGRVKLSATSSAGQTLILKVAKPGEVLGLNAAVSGTAHETSAETGQVCQLNFVKKDEFIRFITQNGDACLHAAIHLSNQCQQAYQQIRSFGLRSASERIARLMLDWSLEDGRAISVQGIRVALTHDEIGQIIGMSRETVTRTLAAFRRDHVAELHSSTLVIQDLPALQRLAAN